MHEEGTNLRRKPEILNDIVSYIGFLKTSQDYCDAAFNCLDGRVPAHRAILGTRSRLVRDLCDQGEIEIYTLEFKTAMVEQLLNLIYTGTINVHEGELDALNQLILLLGIDLTFDRICLPNRKRKLKIKHENNLSSRKAEQKQPTAGRKKRILMANLDRSELTCDVCFKVFPKLYKLKNHQLIHLSSFPFICSECGKGFKNKYKLNAHEKDHLKVDMEVGGRTNIVDRPPPRQSKRPAKAGFTNFQGG